MENWYRFKNGEILGTKRVRYYLVCFYEGNDCYDESVFSSLDEAIPFAMASDDTYVTSRVFAIIDNDAQYEIKLERV